MAWSAGDAVVGQDAMASMLGSDAGSAAPGAGRWQGVGAPRILQGPAGNFSDFTSAYLLFFGLQLVFFVTMPLIIMLWRLLRSARSKSLGFMVMLKAPIGRIGDKRSPAAALRFFLFQETSLGYYADLAQVRGWRRWPSSSARLLFFLSRRRASPPPASAPPLPPTHPARRCPQALFSAISCLMFIAVSYSAYDPEILQDIEFFFTSWFVCDYAVRLYIAQDSLAFFFSGVSLLDFITVVPAIVTWIMSGFSEFETNIQVIVQCIRVMRVFRIFRVIRVIRVISVSQSFAFQRQVSVLVLTVLSLVFAAAGMFQILESTPGWEYPFTSAVYYAAITVIGRPGVGFKNTLVTPIFLTVLGMSAATIIPTFVAELIRLWYDNTALDKYPGNEETPHVIICGDNNASRLRVLVGQLFHASRNPNRTAPVVILAEGKPEGALRALLEEHKHSGNVTHVRGTGKRTADLRRAGAAHAGTVIVLNYRADRDAGSADTEVLSTVMAVKNVKPSLRVLAQLHRPRYRNALRLVPGWKEMDRAVACTSLGMTLLGLSTHLPGFSTLVVNLVRRSALAKSVRGLHYSTGALGVVLSAGELLASSADAGWNAFLYGAQGGAPGAGRDVDPRTGRVNTRTPMEEYGLSMESAVHEVAAPPGCAGLSFAAAARSAFLRHGITLFAAAIPVNAALAALYPQLPRTYRVAAFPGTLLLSEGMRLYALGAGEASVERWRVDNGGFSKNAVQERVEAVEWNPFQTMLDREREEGESSSSGSAASVHDAAAAAAAAMAQRQRLTLNVAAAADISLPWDWKEMDWDGEHYTNAFLALQRGLGLGGGGASPRYDRPAEFVAADAAVAAALAAGEGRGAAAAAPQQAEQAQQQVVPTPALDAAPFLTGSGMLALAPSVCGGGGGAVGEGGSGGSGGAAAAAPLGHSYDPFGGSSSGASSSSTAAAATASAATATAATAATTASAITTSTPTAPSAAALPPPRTRRVSLGDDGFGGIDDTDDVIGVSGLPLATAVPATDSSLTAAASARAASAANTAALAVRLALPTAALASEDLTLVMPTATGTGSGVAGGGGSSSSSSSSSNLSGHIIVCGSADAMGFLLRAVASLATAGAGGGSSSSSSSSSSGGDEDACLATLLRAEQLVLLSPAKPAEGVLNAIYAGSGALLGKVTYIAGSPGDPLNLLRAGVMTARAAVILTLNKPAASADGSDNLSDDTEAILATAVMHKLNPRLHCITELLHGSHAPFIQPTGNNLNDAQRSTFAYILEEREAMAQKAKLDDIISRLQVEARLGGGGSSQQDRLLQKLLVQQARLQRLYPPRRSGGSGASASSDALNARTTDGLAAGSRDASADLDSAFSAMSTSDIVDVIVGVREEFGGAAGAAANEGVGFGGGGGGGSGGASKGSGATNDLFTSPAFAAGRCVAAVLLSPPRARLLSPSAYLVLHAQKKK